MPRTTRGAVGPGNRGHDEPQPAQEVDPPRDGAPHPGDPGGRVRPGQQAELAAAHGQHATRSTTSSRPILVRRGRRRRSSSSARPSSSRSGSGPARAATTVRSRSTATPPSRSAGRSSPRVILAVIAVPTVSTIFDLHDEPGQGRARRHRGRQAVVVAVRLPAAGGDKKVVTADELHIPTGRDVNVDAHARATRRSAPGRRLQRDPQLLGPRARRQDATSSPGTTTR